MLAEAQALSTTITTAEGPTVMTLGGLKVQPGDDFAGHLGTGDVVHGAYAYYRTLASLDVSARLPFAAEVAARRCSVVCPRAWIRSLNKLPSEPRPASQSELN